MIYLMDMKVKLALFMFLGFVLLFTPAFAQEYGVSVSVSPKKITITPCDIATFDIDVKNTGEIEDTFSVLIDGIPEDWYSLSEESFTLDAGEEKKVYLFITPYCYGKFGTYSASVTISDEASATDNFTLVVIPDHEISITMPEEMTLCLKEKTEFSALVRNTGNYTEEITLSVSGNASDFITLTEENFTLDAGEEKNITIIAEPVDVETGIYDLKIKGKSTTSYATSEVSSSLRVIECYKVEVEYPEKVEACVNTSTPFTFSVENTGLKEDTYNVSIEELNFSKTVKLEPKEKRDFEASFFSDEIGSYEVSFIVKSNFVEKSVKIEFDVVRCYGVDVSLEEKEIEIEEGRGKLVKIKLTNIGTKNDTFTVSSDVDWVSIKPSVVSLASNESTYVYAYYSPAYGMLGTFNVSVTASSEKSKDTEMLIIEVMKKVKPLPTENITTIITTENITTAPVLPTTEIPTGKVVGTLEELWENKTIRSILLAIVIVIIILVILYFVVMR